MENFFIFIEGTEHICDPPTCLVNVSGPAKAPISTLPYLARSTNNNSLALSRVDGNTKALRPLAEHIKILIEERYSRVSSELQRRYNCAVDMNFIFTVFIILTLGLYGECKWQSNEYFHHHRVRRPVANQVPFYDDKKASIPDPPDHKKLIPMARYVLHNTNWASIATISILPNIKGFPFSNVKSIVDGSLANSTGIPYFYMSPMDFTARDLARNSRATVLVSLEETNYCEEKGIDPEDPRCTRLILSGKMRKVKEGTPEYTFAKAALFERHPAFANFPPDHNWFVAKLKIAQIAMIDWFGGAKYIPVRDYLAYNYTGLEMLQHAQQTQVTSMT
ncbi:unnamed protein product [Chilo suppressalis]|uniref:CREG-like beta-barrel domain-containing protein n=1 Tax=Chilo suppressalis TaxID=168631 RepID=A0ABN8ATA7_CHISP|nr:unnamed protein product [Chilo suppressalis]